MNLQTLTDTILKEGGASYSLTYGNLAGTKGYALSIYKDREAQIPVNEFNPNELRNFVNENSDLLSNEGHFIGAWVDNGIVYLDISVKIRVQKDAIKMARANKQLAIFDLLNLKTIEV